MEGCGDYQEGPKTGDFSHDRHPNNPTRFPLSQWSRLFRDFSRWEAAVAKWGGISGGEREGRSFGRAAKTAEEKAICGVVSANQETSNSILLTEAVKDNCSLWERTDNRRNGSSFLNHTAPLGRINGG
ncbi:uncharacterized protein CLUP02_15346 [Colletotrichum lupini]|uniref:Uncharacterized protein n=1 Tax=Colletotrichum lupini TaxID=145971 RepID=A0A9Q8T6P3_9PEZI|nr:uncharacterized protein CLUP02_15346 [Colletotrichum lupini]UQC89815.1 hypothetical protein CLUP02_15346 [Colletotrichum lupini]